MQILLPSRFVYRSTYIYIRSHPQFIQYINTLNAGINYTNIIGTVFIQMQSNLNAFWIFIAKRQELVYY